MNNRENILKKGGKKEGGGEISLLSAKASSLAKCFVDGDGPPPVGLC